MVARRELDAVGILFYLVIGRVPLFQFVKGLFKIQQIIVICVLESVL